MIRLSCDDGCASDVRVAELATKYSTECVFYWPVEWERLAYENGYEPLTQKQARAIAERFEIGSHTITHRHLTRIPEAQAKWEIHESKSRLMQMFDQAIDKFCPPRGYTTPELTEFTLLHYKSQRLTKGRGLVHVHPDSGANDNLPWRFVASEAGAKELWFHSYELDRYDLWNELEDYLKEVTAK